MFISLPFIIELPFPCKSREVIEWSKESVIRPVKVRQYHKWKVKAEVKSRSRQTEWEAPPAVRETSERMGGIWAQPDTK